MANYNFPTLPPKGSKLHVNDTITIGYTGDWQGSAFTWIPYKRVKIECWGARGGYGAWGGYTWGIVDFSSQPTTKALFYIVGQAGRWVGSSNPRNRNLTYGGGGEGDNNLSGGGATDVRTYINPNSYGNVILSRLMQENIDKGTMEWNSLSSRLIIAGGGGGTDSRGGTQGSGNYGGGFQGWGNRSSRPGGNGGQTYGGGAGSGLETDGYDAVFGAGASGYSATGGGGGGLYGGGRGDGGGGGSSYVSGIAPCVFETSSGIKFESGGTTAGGAANMTNGKIVITILEEITLGDVDYGDPGTKNPPKNPEGPQGLTDDDIADLNYIDASRNISGSVTAIVNTKDFNKIFGSFEDGPRNSALKSNKTYATCANSSNYVSPASQAANAINNTPTNTVITNNTSTNIISTDGNQILNTNAIIHHGCGRRHGVERHYTFLYKIPLKIFNSGVNYEAHLKGKIRYYYPGGGSSMGYYKTYDDMTYGNPNFGRKAEDLNNFYNGSGVFCFCMNADNITAGQTVNFSANYAWEFPYDKNLTDLPASQYTSCDKLTHVNSFTGILGPFNQYTGNMDGSLVGTPPNNSSSDWGRIFEIDCTIPIGGNVSDDLSIVIGMMSFGWGSAGGGSAFGGGGNYNLYFQCSDLSINYTANWGEASEEEVRDKGISASGGSVTNFYSESLANYLKSSSSKSYKMLSLKKS